MSTRTVQGSRNQSFSEGLLEDILRHTNDQTYDVVFIPGTDGSTHNYHITCFAHTKVAMNFWTRIILAGTLSAALVAGMPSRSVETKRDNVEWDFSLYQNARCTGETERHSGLGTTGCNNGILNGNAVASIKTFMDPDCTVLFFSDNNCTPNNVIDGIDETTSTDCRLPTLPNSAITSWAVH
ncbi:hypothetical protein MMC29_007375, partial [Sticta canariensis]|nr:hypothetical protein [Sticta canariensis]